MIELNINFLFDIINIIILFLILRKFLINPVMNVINQRNEMIEKDLEDARNKNRDAEKILEEYNSKLNNIHTESREILNRSRENATVQSESIISEAKEQAEKIIKDAREISEAEKNKAIEEARYQISSLAIEATEKILSDTNLSALNKGAYDDFIRKAGERDENDIS